MYSGSVIIEDWGWGLGWGMVGAKNKLDNSTKIAMVQRYRIHGKGLYVDAANLVKGIFSWVSSYLSDAEFSLEKYIDGNDIVIVIRLRNFAAQVVSPEAARQLSQNDNQANNNG